MTVHPTAELRQLTAYAKQHDFTAADLATLTVDATKGRTDRPDQATPAEQDTIRANIDHIRTSKFGADRWALIQQIVAEWHQHHQDATS